MRAASNNAARISLVALLLALPAPSQTARGQARFVARVVVAAQTLATGDRITLGDVAEVTARDATVAERLRAVQLGFAPQVGAVRELSRERVALAVAAAGFAAPTVEVVAPPVALVRRASQVVDPALVRDAVGRAALSGLSVAGAEARLTRLELPARIEAPAGRVEVRANASGVRDPFRPFAVSVELLVDGKVARRLSLTAEVEAVARVLVAARDIPRGTRVGERDVALAPVRLEAAPGLYLTDASRLRGVAAARGLKQGEAVLARDLSAELVVRAGDAVRIVGTSGRASVSVAGEARASGRVGDRIAVKNTASGATLQATVEDEGLVSVRF